jgi:hypothetical protein
MASFMVEGDQGSQGEQIMAHTTHQVARLIDAINRDGFEWLVGYLRYPAGTLEYYQLKYQDKGNAWLGPVAYAWGLIWRLALTFVLPVLPLSYMATRTLALAYRAVNVFNWGSRFVSMKTLLMGLALMPAAFTIAFVPRANLVAMFTRGVSHALLNLVPAPILALSFGTFLTASLLYLAKLGAQRLNATLYNGKTNPKHVLSRCEEHDSVKPLHLIHTNHFQAYEDLKKMTRERPSNLKLPVTSAGELTTSEGVTLTPLEYAEKTLSKGKEMFAKLETVIEGHHIRCLHQKDHEALVKPGEGLFWSWKTQLKALGLAPGVNGEDPDIQLNNYRFDKTNHRLSRNSH